MSNRSTSYRYVQQFVEKQIKYLKEDVLLPERLQAAVDEGIISEKEALKLHRKLSDHIRRDVSGRYRAQEKHLVVEQVCQLEHENALLAATQLSQVENALGPLSLPDFDRVAVGGDIMLEFTQIIDELPRREYLQTASTTESEQVLDRYEELRDDLGKLRDQWLYNTDKLEYLQRLRQAIRASLKHGGDNLGDSEGVSNYLYDSNEEVSDTEDTVEDMAQVKEMQNEMDQFNSLLQSKIYQRNN